MAWRDILDMIFSVIKTAEPVDILDILVLSYVVYVVMKLVRETRAGQLVKGIMLLFLVYIVASWIKMKAISYLMSETLNIGMIALVILFQPELRRTLEKAGYTKLGLRFSMNAGADDGIWLPASCRHRNEREFGCHCHCRFGGDRRHLCGGKRRA